MARIGKVAVCCLFAILGLWQIRTAMAERTRYWRQSSFEDFEKGVARGVALRSDGRLILAPRFTQVADPNLAYLWVLRTDSKGQLYAGGGSNAKVYRFDDKGTGTAIFDSPELTVQAMAFDSRDNLYIGTSPDGKVYRVTPRGERSVFFEPKTKYIWDLVVDASGSVFVATGDKGEIFLVSPDGISELFYRSTDTHIRSLALDPKGNLIAGTEPYGRIVRIDRSAPAPKDKSAGRDGFVIFETDRKEVTALLFDSQGNLYAASIGEKPRTPLPQTQVQPIVPQTTISTGGQVATAQVVPVQTTPFAPFPALVGGSEVYRITPDGAPEVLWSSREDLVYSLAFSPSGKLLLGTGNKGQVVRLEGNRIHATLPKTAAAQVTGMLVTPGGKVFVATSNPGKLFALGPEYEAEGTFESQPFDARVFSQWGRLTWWGEDGATNGSVEFYVRSGNTSSPEKHWSPWSGPYKDPKGEIVNCPPARFLQWKAVLKNPPGSDGRSPAVNISWVSVAYLPKNIAPSVDAIVVQNPNVRVQGFPSQPQQQQTAQLRLPPVAGAPGSQPSASSSGQQQRFEAPPQGFVQRGFYSVLWSAHDDNDDDLVYSVYFRGEGETQWKLLRDRVEQKFLSWESTSLPDGAYVLKIVASDAPSNPPDQALSSERISDRFEVDNTPPAVEGLRAEPANPGTRIRFVARDSFSRIARAEYSLNAGDWMLVFPVDRLSDAPTETYEILLKDLPAGEHTLAVRVFDQFENVVGAKLTFTAGPSQRK
jgi:sugar lactone lactonase YvrE